LPAGNRHPHPRLLEWIDEFLGEYDKNGWKVGDLIDSADVDVIARGVSSGKS
jgi:hypothetical protein